MKKLLLLSILALPISAQNPPPGVPSGLLANRPTSCQSSPIAQQYWATDNTTLYICSPAGTWNAVSGGSGSTAFSAITSGTNTAAAMVVGTGASLAASGTGVISASQINGAAVPTDGNLTQTNGSGQLVSSGIVPGNVVTSTGNITQGYVWFGQGSKVPGSDSLLFWDATNHRLGIGATPIVPLHVQGPSGDSNGTAYVGFFNRFGKYDFIQTDNSITYVVGLYGLNANTNTTVPPTPYGFLLNAPNGLRTNSASFWCFDSTSTGVSSPDTCLKRSSAGVIEIDNGTTGAYRDLLLRTLEPSSILSQGSAPSVSVSGTSCAVGTPVTGSNNITGKIPITGTGVACVITLTWSGSLTYTNGSSCAALQDSTAGTLATVSSDTTTSITFSALAMTNGDTIRYSGCTGY